MGVGTNDLAGFTEFGTEVWVLAARRGISTQKRLADAIEVNHNTLRNYLYGRTAVPAAFLRSVDSGLGLTEEERHSLGEVFAWGETVRVKVS